MLNNDNKVINDFGLEWGKYQQNNTNTNFKKIFDEYFSIFPKDILNNKSVGFDAGCGSGRWAKFIAPKVKTLYCIDPSQKALNVAKKNLAEFNNCIFEYAKIDDSLIEKGSQDFGYSLGVLHHITNTKKALKSCTSKLKKNAPFLLYLYYKFDNKPLWYVYLWKTSDIFRLFISKLPFKVKLFVTEVLAFIVYFPLARISYLIEKIGFDVENIPLSYYRKKSFYVMRTDSLDKFGTRLEQRFTRKEIKTMMGDADLHNIKFSESPPFWVAIGFKR